METPGGNTTVAARRNAAALHRRQQRLAFIHNVRSKFRRFAAADVAYGVGCLSGR
jgi:hypothetical protein